MPRPLAATLVAEAWVESLQRKLQIKLMKYKGKLREHLVVIYQGQREYSPILLSQTPGDRRADLSAQLEQVPLHDLPDSFAAALFGGNTSDDGGKFDSCALPAELQHLGPVTEGDRTGSQTAFFMHSADSVRDDWRSRHRGSRTGTAADSEFPEAARELEEQGLDCEVWLSEVSRLIDQADVILDDVPHHHVAAVRALQDALVEMVGVLEDEPADEESPQPCLPCEPDEPTELEEKATAFFASVREELAWSVEEGPLPTTPLAVLKASYKGCAGGLVLTSSKLLWVAMGSHFSKPGLCINLGDIDRCAAGINTSPFGTRATFAYTTDARNTAATVTLACGSQAREAEVFALEVDCAISAACPSRRPSHAEASSSAATPAVHSAPSAPRQTKQKTAAADLRAKLKRVVELQRSHAAGSNAQADELLAGLRAGDGKEPSIHTIYKQSEHLRDVALGFGGYALAKRVIEQFLKMPMVQLMLPDLLREQMDDARDAQAAKELLAQAKAFFTGIFGVGFRGGRLSDEDRNAVAAASAAILPRDLFAKRGRAAAASRLTGLGYRRLHRGSDARRELEDRACGWRRVRTAGHKDKVDYGPLHDFWHSDLASTEDNQNKHMVPSHLHAARACACGMCICSR